MKPLSPLKQYLLGFGLIFLALLLGLWLFFYTASQPLRGAEAQMKSWANHYAKLQEVTDFTRFAGQATYYSIEGRDETQQVIRLLWTPGTDQPELINMAEGLDRQEVLDLAGKQGIAIDGASFGRYQNQLVWEIQSGQTYYLFDFKTGELIRQFG